MFNPGYYKIEQLRYANDFNIYSPVDTSFKFETIDDDNNPHTLDDIIVQESPGPPHYINRPPNKPHVIRGDFDNNPTTDITLKNFSSRPLRGGINGISPNPNPRPPHHINRPPNYDKIKKMLKNTTFKRKYLFIYLLIFIFFFFIFSFSILITISFSFFGSSFLIGGSFVILFVIFKDFITLN
jgi:hypothetical protein